MTSSRPSGSSRRPACRTRRSSRSPRASATSIPTIDARVNDVAKGQQWTGFHRIEQALWERPRPRAWTPIADKLLADVETLEARTRTLAYQPDELANGANGLLNEVASSKITGEEDRYSHTDLSDFQANLDGAQTTFGLLAPALKAKDPALASDDRAALRRRAEASSSTFGPGGGFPSYDDRRRRRAQAARPAGRRAREADGEDLRRARLVTRVGPRGACCRARCAPAPRRTTSRRSDDSARYRQAVRRTTPRWRPAARPRRGC